MIFVITGILANMCIQIAAMLLNSLPLAILGGVAGLGLIGIGTFLPYD